MSAIITTADLSTYVGETLDTDRAQQVVDALNDYIEDITGRCFGETLSGTETHDYASVIFLRHQDLITVTSVEKGRGSGETHTIDADAYFVNAYGRLVLDEGSAGFSPRRDYIKVTYTYGVPAVPADLKLSALSLAADFYSYAAEGNTEVSAEQIGSYKVAYAKGDASASGRTLSANFKRYATRRV